MSALRAEAEETGEHSLKRKLGPLNLITLGIGAIIGAGIFVLTGQAAALHAGPAVPISMILVGIACTFAGLCYAEMASTVPVAGSAYTYSYATMGELIAWIIGWDLVLEYAAGAATVGVGWSGHLVSLVNQFGINLPGHLTQAPTRWCTEGEVTRAVAGCAHAGLNLTGALLNLPAVFIVAVMSTILVVGIKESASVNNFIVILKVAIVLLIVGVGLKSDADPVTGSLSFPPAPASGALTAYPVCFGGPAWCSSPISGSMPYRRRPRRLKIRNAIFRSGFWAH